MFDFDNFREIWGTIRKNKLRTFLTGFSVAWGIFMLIVLLGAGNGLRNGVFYNFRNISRNEVEMWPDYVSKAWKGLQVDRHIQLTEKDVELVKDLPEVNLYSAVVFNFDTLTFNKEMISCQILAAHPDYSQIHYVTFEPGNGRFINDVDQEQRRKVIVINPHVAEVLFRHKEPLGQYVRVGKKCMMKVVGVYKDEEKSNDATAYIPFSTGQIIFNKGVNIDQIAFTVQGLVSSKDNDAFEKRLREKMARFHQFDPTDTRAIRINNTAEDFRMMNKVMDALSLFIWIVGIATLMAGIVGVSNIMLITVRERTREFGIRKALGAKPASILNLVITESLCVTAIFGYIGMLIGIGITEIINYFLQNAKPSPSTEDLMGNISIFRDPTVSLGIALGATLLIVIAGVVAGYFPARKAIKITAIEAMRTDE